MQVENGAGHPAVEPAAESTAVPDELGQQTVAIEDWVSQESISMPKDTNGTLIQKFNAALQLLQMVADKVSCHPSLKENCLWCGLPGESSTVVISGTSVRCLQAPFLQQNSLIGSCSPAGCRYYRGRDCREDTEHSGSF